MEHSSRSYPKETREKALWNGAQSGLQQAKLELGEGDAKNSAACATLTENSAGTRKVVEIGERKGLILVVFLHAVLYIRGRHKKIRKA